MLVSFCLGKSTVDTFIIRTAVAAESVMYYTGHIMFHLWRMIVMLGQFASMSCDFSPSSSLSPCFGSTVY